MQILLRSANRTMELFGVFGDGVWIVRKGERVICRVKLLVALMMTACVRAMLDVEEMLSIGV